MPKVCHQWGFPVSGASGHLLAALACRTGGCSLRRSEPPAAAGVPVELARGPASADARRTWARGQHSDRTARLSGIPRSGKIAGIMPKAATPNAKSESPRCPLGTGKPRAFGDFRPARTHLPLSAVSVLPTASFDVRAKIIDSGFLVEGSVNQSKIRSPAKI